MDGAGRTANADFLILPHGVGSAKEVVLAQSMLLADGCIKLVERRVGSHAVGVTGNDAFEVVGEGVHVESGWRSGVNPHRVFPRLAVDDGASLAELLQLLIPVEACKRVRFTGLTKLRRWRRRSGRLPRGRLRCGGRGLF